VPAGGRQDVVGPGGPQPVRLREAPVKVPEVAQIGQRGRLIDHGIGSRGRDRGHRGRGVQDVQGDRLGTERPQRLGLGRRARAADDLMPSLAQLRNDPGADRAAGSYHQDSHDLLLHRLGVQACPT
jgi:hypothetical protein